ncbi:MAG: hypothetical protein M1835_008033 [Candelina submexicana]|nr:MAG: hypothetical protein M1835_008033 [Candelina submexicana]
MSLSILRSAVASVNWGLVAQYGLEAATLALTTWLARSKSSPSTPAESLVAPLVVGPSSTPRRKTRKSEATRSKQKVEPQLRSSVRLRREAPAETLPQAQKKKVTFAEGEPEVRLVDKWIDRKVHQHRKRPYEYQLGRKVTFHHSVRIEYVENWINDTWPKCRVDYDGDVVME